MLTSPVIFHLAENSSHSGSFKYGFTGFQTWNIGNPAVLAGLLPTAQYRRSLCHLSLGRLCRKYTLLWNTIRIGDDISVVERLSALILLDASGCGEYFSFRLPTVSWELIAPAQECLLHNRDRVAGYTNAAFSRQQTGIYVTWET